MIFEFSFFLQAITLAVILQGLVLILMKGELTTGKQVATIYSRLISQKSIHVKPYSGWVDEALYPPLRLLPQE